MKLISMADLAECLSKLDEKEGSWADGSQFRLP